MKDNQEKPFIVDIKNPVKPWPGHKPNEKLLPCPFCGGDVVILIKEQYRFVRCVNCRARSEAHFHSSIAINAWNTRTPQPPENKV